MFRDHLRAANSTVKRVLLWLRIVADFAVTVPVRHLENVSHRRYLHTAFADYSEPARHAIFFARQEADSFDGPEISLEHLLLGTLRRDRELAAAILGREGLNGIVRDIETQQANPRCLPAYSPADIPLSVDSRKALAQALQTAHASGAQLSLRHLLSAILRQDTTPASRFLRERAVDLSFLT